MRRVMILAALLLAAPTLAQTATNTPPPTSTLTNVVWSGFSRDCGNGLPCGPIPWSLPRYPDLVSPTPFPTVVVSSTPSPTLSPTVTLTPSISPTASNTPTPTITSTSYAESISDSIATLQGQMDATLPVISASGTPVNIDSNFTQLGLYAGEFFGYAQGVMGLSFGKVSPLLVFAGLAFLTIISIYLILFALPLLAAVIGFLRKAVQFILDFIPG